MEIKAIIPARGSSKRLPNKNILDFVGKPLLCHTIAQALLSRRINSVTISTEADCIKAVARKFFDAELLLKPLSIINRPPELATDEASVIDVVRHAKEHWQNNNINERYLIVMLYPTYPLRTAELIDEVINYALNVGHGNFVTIKLTDKTIFWDVEQNADGRIKKIIPNEYFRTQDMPVVYRMAGAVHAFYSDELPLLDRNGISQDMYGFLVTNPEYLIEVDDLKSFEIAEKCLLNRLETQKQYQRFMESDSWVQKSC